MSRFLILVMVACAPSPAAVLAGRVLEDHSSVPLRRAVVRIFSGSAAGPIAELETDTEGRFGSPDLPESEYRVELSKTSYLPVAARVPLRENLVFRMVRYGAISGRVADPRDQAISGAQIVAYSQLEKVAARTNSENGEYRIYNLPPGKYRLAIITMGNRGFVSGVQFQPNNSEPREFVVSGGEEYAHADFRVDPHGDYTLSGSVQMPPGARSVMISVTAPDRPELRLFQRLVQGEFKLDHILPGTYDLLASITGKPAYSGKLRVVIDAADVSGLSIPVLEEPEKKAAPPAKVGVARGQASREVILLSPDLLSMRVAFPDEHGQYSFEGLAPGSYYLVEPAQRWMPEGLRLPAAIKVDGHEQ